MRSTRAGPVIVVWLAIGAMSPLSDAQPRESDVRRAFSVTHYDVELEPRLESRTVTGSVTLSVVLHRDDVETIALNRGSLEIDTVREGGRAHPFLIEGNRVRITLPRGRPNQTRTLTVTYHGMPASGLVFNVEREQIYTVFATSQWMVALDDPDARATLRLRLTCHGHGSAPRAVGRSLDADLDGQAPHGMAPGWPVPTYTFGFVVGALSEVTERAGNVTLQYVGRHATAGDLKRTFDESARMIAFFEQRAGVSYPGDTYAQALVARTVGQEMAGLSIFSEEYRPRGHCRSLRDRADRARARPSVVGQHGHLPRLDRVLAQ